MINNVVIVSGGQHGDSVIHKHVSILPQTALPSRLPCSVELSSLCYTVGPCCVSFLKWAFGGVPWWLGFWAFTAMAQVQSLVGEQKKEKTKQKPGKYPVPNSLFWGKMNFRIPEPKPKFSLTKHLCFHPGTYLRSPEKYTNLQNCIGLSFLARMFGQTLVHISLAWKIFRVGIISFATQP